MRTEFAAFGNDELRYLQQGIEAELLHRALRRVANALAIMRARERLRIEGNGTRH